MSSKLGKTFHPKPILRFAISVFLKKQPSLFLNGGSYLSGKPVTPLYLRTPWCNQRRKKFYGIGPPGLDCREDGA